MTGSPLPEEERRSGAVRLACRILVANGVRELPADPETLAAGMGISVCPLSAAAETGGLNACDFARRRLREEALTVAFGRNYLIFYDDGIRSPERIRFSLCHELGHILMRHFEDWDPGRLSLEAAQVLEDEANTFARNILCPPPVAELVRGEARSAGAALFGLSGRAWEVRLRTLEDDRRLIDRRTADLVRIQFREYMFGRRCRRCGAVFTDEVRANRCPACGSAGLVWNPRMETREEAAEHRHAAGAGAEDLKPRIGEAGTTDLTAFWRMLGRQDQPSGRKPRYSFSTLNSISPEQTGRMASESPMGT